MAGFMKALGKGLLRYGAPVAASFIPGGGVAANLVRAGVSNLGNIAGPAGDVGTVASGAAGALRDERQIEDEARRQRDQIALDRARTGINQGQTRDAQNLNRAGFTEDATLARAKMGIDAPMARTRQAAYGDALKNIQDVNIDFQPQTGPATKFNVTGGLRPSMFGENARAAGGELGRQALLALMTKSDVPGMPTLPAQSDLVDLPELSQPKGSGALEKITGGVGLGGSILGALGPLLQQIKKRPPATMPRPVPDVPVDATMAAWRRRQPAAMDEIPRPNAFVSQRPFRNVRF